MEKMSNQGGILTDRMSDNDIVLRVLSGEKDLYALLVSRYNQRLYRIAMSIIKDDAEAEDVMQVAYIHAYENLARFEFRSGFSTWLTRILINESLLRVKRRKQSWVLENDQGENEIYQRAATKVQNPLMKLLNAELKEVLEEAIYQLPEKYRTVFIMREIEDMNVAETQACLDLSEANVKVRLNRAKAMLRNSLNAFYKNEEILHFHLSRCERVRTNVMSKIGNL
jgi:RNA polymerase sigma factor (sigma-70 family)